MLRANRNGQAGHQHRRANRDMAVVGKHGAPSPDGDRAEADLRGQQQESARAPGRRRSGFITMRAQSTRATVHTTKQVTTTAPHRWMKLIAMYSFQSGGIACPNASGKSGIASPAPRCRINGADQDLQIDDAGSDPRQLSRAECASGSSLRRASMNHGLVKIASATTRQKNACAVRRMRHRDRQRNQEQHRDAAEDRLRDNQSRTRRSRACAPSVAARRSHRPEHQREGQDRDQRRRQRDGYTRTGRRPGATE